MPDKQNKVIIETTDGKKTVEFTEKEFNELSYLVVKRIESGVTKELKVLKLTKNKSLILA